MFLVADRDEINGSFDFLELCFMIVVSMYAPTEGVLHRKNYSIGYSQLDCLKRYLELVVWKGLGIIGVGLPSLLPPQTQNPEIEV